MFLSVNDLKGYSVLATDGRLGSVRDVLYDDQNWTLRYLVIDTGGWLSARKVLVSPAALELPDVQRQEFPVALTKQQIEDSPPLDADAPVSRQKELELTQYYGWPTYWNTAGYVKGPPPFMPPVGTPVARAQGQETATVEHGDLGDPHLRSARETIGYFIAATDGLIGSIYDLLVDSRGWIIRYAVIDTGNWLPGKKVVLPPTWITEFDWGERTAHVAISRGQVKGSPAYDPAAGIEREDEARLYGYHGIDPYW